MRWYFSGLLSFRYHRMWSCWGERERESRAGRTGALKHDLLDLAVLELAARASLIPRVILFGHKLVKNQNAWMTSRHTQRLMKSLAFTPPSLTLLVYPLKTKSISKIAGCKSHRSARRSRLILIGGRRQMERFVLIRQQIWRCFMWLSTVNDFSLPSILEPWPVFCLGKRRWRNSRAEREAQ